MRVLNIEHGDLLMEYINFILNESFVITEEDNDKFVQFHKLIKGIIRQSDEVTELDSIMGDEVIKDWLFSTPNLIFHAYNGFCVGMGHNDHVCSDILMARTLNLFESLKRLKIKRKPNFISYVRD